MEKTEVKVLHYMKDCIEFYQHPGLPRTKVEANRRLRDSLMKPLKPIIDDVKNETFQEITE